MDGLFDCLALGARHAVCDVARVCEPSLVDGRDVDEDADGRVGKGRERGALDEAATDNVAFVIYAATRVGLNDTDFRVGRGEQRHQLSGR